MTRVLAGALLCALLLPSPPVFAGGDATLIETEFERAIKVITPATVVCLPRDIKANRVPSGGTSGVVISSKGLVLSDGDVGTYFDLPTKSGEKPVQHWAEEIEIRVPSLSGKGFKSHYAKVIVRDRKLDTCLIKFAKPPSGLRAVSLGTSHDLRVGDFTFVMGNSFGMASEGTSTLTAGVISALTPSNDEGVPIEHIYTSAAVSPGVNGGPIVNAEGRLIGTISTFMRATERFQFLGKAVPIDRLRAFYLAHEKTKDLFPKTKTAANKNKRAGKLELVFHHAAMQSYPSVVSIEIKRKGKLEHIGVSRTGPVSVPRYTGPVSGFAVDKRGHIVTSLYNLANVGTLAEPRWTSPPDKAKVFTGIEQIESIQVHFQDGASSKAELAGYSEESGLVLLRATNLPDNYTPQVLKPVADEQLEVGRFVVGLGNPYGDKPLSAPLVTVGVLSKKHREDAGKPWAGHWQTDAGCIDANCGGPAVNIRGELYGMLNIWTPVAQGRNSGIGYVVPWSIIRDLIPSLAKNKRPPLVGLIWGDAEEGGSLVIREVSEGGGAAEAGLKSGDVVMAIAGAAVSSVSDAKAALRGKWAGDTIDIEVDRRGDKKTFKVKLGERKL